MTEYFPDCKTLRKDKRGEPVNLKHCFTSKCDDCVDGSKGCWGGDNCKVQRLRCITTPCPKSRVAIPTDTPLMAATGKGNPVAAREVVGEAVSIEWTDEPADVRNTGYTEKAKSELAEIISAAVVTGGLKLEVLKNTPSKMKKERDIVLSDTYNLSASEIARLDGATDANVRSKSDTIQKRIDRSK